MKQTSGMYTEMEWIKSDSAKTGSAPADAKSVEAVKMNGSEWQESVRNSQRSFAAKYCRASASLPNGLAVASAPATMVGSASTQRRRYSGTARHRCDSAN